ncbi:MAG: extracellular solute-binding protein [Chloroflexi bacterium]|nr:extracellular solute-binding protein [Chloroflexota bacterium]
MKRRLSLALGVVGLVSLMSTCAPKPVAPPAPAPTAAPATPAPASKLSSATAQDAAWDKVIATAKKEGVVTVYSFFYVGDMGKDMARTFQQRYGIRVEILASPGRQTVEKLKVEQAVKQPVADVVNTGTSSATEISVAGLGENVWRELPSLKDRSAFLIDPVYSPSGDLLFSSLTLVAPAINTSLVKPQDEPRSFKDFLDPKWKGNVLSLDPRTGGGGMFTTIATMKYFKVLEDDYWKQLAPQLQLFGGSQQEQYRMVARGEYQVALPASDSPLAPLIAEGAPMKLLAMDEGTVAQGDSIMVVKGGPHPNAARLFVDWVLSPEGQEVYARASKINPMRKGVPGYMIPGANITPKKVINRTWEAAQAGNDYQKAGLMEQLFGKR